MFCRKSIDLSFNAGTARALEYQGRLVTEVNNLPVAPCPTLDKLVCCNEDSSENDVFVWCSPPEGILYLKTTYLEFAKIG
jgi:hypothetical protein